MRLAVLLLLTACRDQPTWSQDVAPIIGRRCLPCHESIAPPLADGADAARAAAQIVRSVERREMPPSGVDNTGHCGTFPDPWLTRDEIATLSRWAQAGAPVDHGRATPPHRPRPPADLILTADEWRPGLGEAATRCFPLPPLAEDFVVGAIAGDAPLQLSLATACRDGRLLASWSWTAPVQHLADGLTLPAHTPLFLHARADLVALGLSATVRPRLTLTRGTGTASLVAVRAATDAPAIGGRTVVVEADHVVAAPALLRGVVPRPGSTARLVDVAVHRGATRTCAAHFGHWMPAQERLYLRDVPLELQIGDVVRASCTYDAADRAARIRDGHLDDAACAVELYVTSSPVLPAAGPSSSR